MKKLIIAAMLVMTIEAQASTEKMVKSTVKNVTVFTQGAQVFRTAQVNLTPGVTDLIFSGLSPFMNASGIQAGGKGNFIILEVKQHIKYPEPPNATEGTLPKEILREIKLIEDSLLELSFNSDDLTEKKSALQLEKNMIVKNKLALGEGKSDSLPVLKDAMEFFRIKLNDINSQLIKIKRSEQHILTNNTWLTARLNDLKTYKNSEEHAKKYEPMYQVIVTVSAEEIIAGTVDISYTVSNAGWTPSYDLRSGNANSTVELTYKANVFQHSGEAWNDVHLKLSTSNPDRNNIKPELPIWYINYYYPRRELNATGAARAPIPMDEYQEKKDLAKQVEELSPAQSAANYSQIIETMTNIEFDVKLAYSIPSDGTNHVVSVKNGELPANYYHYLVPKVENEAFLIAKVTGWEELNLLPGKATIFYEGTYVGETMLNPAVLSDTLELALGRDHGITVTRTKLPVKQKNKLLGDEIVKMITYELKMKNNKNKTVNLVIEDQIPISQNKDIKVELTNDGKAIYNKETGLLKWSTSLISKENRTLSFTYSVTSNKDMPLSMY